MFSSAAEKHAKKVNSVYLRCKRFFDRNAVIRNAQAVRVCMAAGLTFLVMRQVMPMAAGLASGLALSSFGAVSAALAWGFGGAVRSSNHFMRGLVMDRESTRWDPISRKSGYLVQRGVVAGARQLARLRGENTVRRR